MVLGPGEIVIAKIKFSDDWPSLVMQKGNEEVVYRLLLRLKQGHSAASLPFLTALDPPITPTPEARCHAGLSYPAP